VRRTARGIHADTRDVLAEAALSLERPAVPVSSREPAARAIGRCHERAIAMITAGEHANAARVAEPVATCTQERVEALIARARIRAHALDVLVGAALELVLSGCPVRRREDIPQLVESFLGGRALARASCELLMSYDWPGNVRELRNVVDRAVALVADSGELDPSAFLMSTPPPPRAAWPTLGTDGDFFATKDRLIAEWERRYLVDLLERAGGNVSSASRNSGIGRSYLHRLMRKHKLRGHDDG
jgi:DNA-binding NtrC family response regulator